MKTKTSRHVIGLLAGSSHEIGGVERQILSLLERADQERYYFVVFTPSVFARVIKSRSLKNVETLVWAPRNGWDLHAARTLVATIRAKKVDLLHIHDPRSGVLGRVVGKWLRLPTIYTVHLPPYYYAPPLKRSIYEWLEGLLNRWFTDRVLYVSYSVCEEAISRRLVPRDRASVIVNGIDLRVYSRSIDRTAVRRTLETPEESTVFCFVGRLTQQKGVDVLLRAVTMVREQGRCFRLWLVGDGPLRSQLEQYVARHGLMQTVQFLGYRNDVLELLKASDVFVLPSRYEAMPFALLEAMAAGLPSIVTCVGDNVKLIENGVTGLIVPPEDFEALASALTRMLSNSELRQKMGEAARKKAQEYSAERMVAQITELYASLLNKGSRNSIDKDSEK